MKGTILNTSTVAVGSLIGLGVGKVFPAEAQTIAISGVALVTFAIGIKMFFGSKNVLIVAFAVALGGILGWWLGIQSGIDHLAEWVKTSVGGGGKFTEGLVTAFVLFCVGPLTLLGCIQDGLEGKSELLYLKSTMDGVCSIILAATFGVGVLFSAVFVFVFQAAITLLARPLSFLKTDQELLAELEGSGGPIMMAIALSVLDIKKFPTANYLPALALAPMMVLLSRRLTALTKKSEASPSQR